MKNMIFVLNEGFPKYKQIYEQLKSYIECGDIPSHNRLPSIRQLADSLQTSRNTTLTAYEQLVAEGYVRGEGRKGYYVNELEPRLIQKQEIPSLINKNPKKNEVAVRIDFRAGAVDQTHFPLKIWRKLSNQVLTLSECFKYGEVFGEMDLRQQISIYLFQSRGVKVEPDAIVIGSSTQQLLIYLGQILKEEHEGVIVEDPGYDGAKEAFQFHSYEIETLPIDERGADLSELEKMKSKLIYVTPSHQSPLGVSMSIQQRQLLIHWANKVKGFIIEDDYDSEFRYTQQPFPALAAIDSSRVVYLGNFSKALLPGIRLSYMVLPHLLVERYKSNFLKFESTVSLQHQLTMSRFMDLGEWDRHIKRMRLVYKRKMQCLVSALRCHFNQSISIIGEQSGLYVLVKVHLNCSEKWLIDRASIYGVKVYATSIYFIDNHPTESIIKLGFSNLSYEDIEEGVKLLKEAWT
ncbi:GntR family transcriptional regulator [Exiguobacterium indicum]|uniref:GntR family transcriptional regulator n=1 Tax=Exiguobacterium indicum TaxID=296995 RepID=A0A0V8GBZ1_9BACL|nr:PLP-dependent aminotransferase family protein [Exiguobacterium enclense]KSU47663.1 GntR family transcriptional regulator [Exiguobacterium enclense]SDD43541.1 transcriptional regulator, GntR family [Exiguobacterium enclense]